MAARVSDKAQGVGRDHFRRNLQAPLLKAIAELLLSGSSEQATKNAEIQEQFLSAAPTQDGLVTWMTKYIVDNTPREAILLELSTATIGPILDALRAANVEARLLVANPYMAQSAWLQERHWMVAVGTALTGGPPHRSQRAELPHWAPASGSGSEAHFREGMLHAGGW